ncbi:hypothetical protein SK128_005079 [Halocaridina rubra]|uniref:C2H2-type domain-containing protein n=1 Tax=Halocaridina rubra TaxID=373956 RepID=A0AAN8WTY4_HALRR
MDEVFQQSLKDGIVTYDEKSYIYICHICNKSTNSITSTAQHLANNKHKEACAWVAISDVYNAPKILLHYLPKDVTDAVYKSLIKATETSGGIPGFLCIICDKTLNGLSPLHQHLKGADHAKKLDRRQLPETVHHTRGENNRVQRSHSADPSQLFSGIVYTTFQSPCAIGSPGTLLARQSSEQFTYEAQSKNSLTAITPQPQLLQRTVFVPNPTRVTPTKSGIAHVEQSHFSDKCYPAEDQDWNNTNQQSSTWNPVSNIRPYSQDSWLENQEDFRRTSTPTSTYKSFPSVTQNTTGAIPKVTQSLGNPIEVEISPQPLGDSSCQSNARLVFGDPASVMDTNPNHLHAPFLPGNTFSEQKNEPSHMANAQVPTTGYKAAANQNQMTGGMACQQLLKPRILFSPTDSNTSAVANRNFSSMPPHLLSLGGTPHKVPNIQQFPRESIKPLELRQGSSPHNLLTMQSPLAQESIDNQVIIYNNLSQRYECQICRIPIPRDLSLSDHICSRDHIEGSKYAIQKPNGAPRSLVAPLPEGDIEYERKGVLIVNDRRAFQCTICDKVFTGTVPFKEHINSFEHKRKTNDTENQSKSRDETDMDEVSRAFRDGLVIVTDNSIEQLKCEVCQITLNGRKNLADHLNGKKHKKKEELVMKIKAIGNPATPGFSSIAQNIGPSDRPGLSREPSNTNEGTDPELMPYPVTSSPVGKVHIFNYLFTDRLTDPKERKGAKEDSTNLMITFSKLDYQVFIWEDLTAEETNDKLDEISMDKELKQMDVLIFFFLSHGRESHKFYTKDVQQLDLKDIWCKFTGTQCPAMKKKPKIFFTNFCRGEDEELPECDAVVDVPRDIVTIHAATEGITALRNTKLGTHFVRALCDILDREGKNLHLREIYIKLSHSVRKIRGRTPKWEDTRFRPFYFVNNIRTTQAVL